MELLGTFWRWRKKPHLAQVGRPRAALIVRQPAGPSKKVTRECDGIAKNYFHSFVTPEMIHLIVIHTNEEGYICKRAEWLPTSEEEISKLIGVFLLAGVYLSKNESVLQMWNKVDGRTIFSRIMPRNRFTELCSFLRFDSKATREERKKTDKLAPFRDI